MFNEKDNDDALGWENSDDNSENPQQTPDAPQGTNPNPAFPSKPVRPGLPSAAPVRPANPVSRPETKITPARPEPAPEQLQPEQPNPVETPSPSTPLPSSKPARTFTPLPVSAPEKLNQPQQTPPPTETPAPHNPEVVSPQTPQPGFEFVEQPSVPAAKKKTRAPKPEKKNRNLKAEKKKKENPYDGSRRSTLIWRVVIGGAAVIIGLAGVQALFFPNTGPTKTQVVDAAQESMNFTGFPSVSGEQFAIDFTRAYFTFTGDQTARNELLSQYASPDLLRQIQVNVLSEQQFLEENPSGDYDSYLAERQITYGPYVVAVNNITEASSVFTVKLGLRSGSVYYVDVPVLYNPEQFSLTLYGPPSFVKPIQNEGETTPSDYTVNWGTGDTEIANSFRSDLEAYLRAWAVSDTTIIDRYTLPSATDNATRGLQGSVEFSSLQNFIVQPENEAANPATARGAEITVTWVDPLTGLEYPQQYRMLLGLNQEGTWSVYDIENFAIFN